MVWLPAGRGVANQRHSGEAALGTESDSWKKIIAEEPVKEDSGESVASKLWRDTRLIADGIGGGMKSGFEEAIKDPGGTGLRLAGTVGVGLILGATQRQAGLLKLGGEVFGISLTGSFISNVLAPERWSTAWDALSATHKSGRNFDANVRKMQDSAGRFAFDTVTNTVLGLGTAKVAQGVFWGAEPKLNDVLAGKVKAAPELRSTIAGKTPLAEIKSTASSSDAQLKAGAFRAVPAPTPVAEGGAGTKMVLKDMTADGRRIRFDSKNPIYGKPHLPVTAFSPLRELETSELSTISSTIRQSNKDVKIAPESIAAARQDINTHGTDPVDGLSRLMRENRILGLGEHHNVGPNAQRQFGAAMMPLLKEAGATHLALEIDIRNQSILDRFARTGEFTPLDRKAINSLHEGGTYEQLLISAREAGLKLVAVDVNPHVADRDTHMAQQIGKVLDADPNSKVVWWVGSNHLGKEFKYDYTATELLRPKYSIAGVRDVIHDRRPGYSAPLASATKDLTAPRLVRTADAANIAGFPYNSYATYGKFDYILVHPPDVLKN